MSKKRVLIVEDSKPIALVIERMALAVGYKVTIAQSFAAVKQLLAKEHDFFVATVDYSLPDASEGQVIPYIIEHGIPAIIMTGRMDDGTRKKLLNFPIVDYVTKENAQAYHYLMRTLHAQLTNHKIGVLVVDDSLTGRNHIKQLLMRRNFNVYGVEDGTKALATLEENDDIKLVITNNQMPGMDGIELVQKIRKKYTRTELIIIGLSSTKGNYQSARFIKNGADDYLSKPFCPEEFYCRVSQNIEKLQYIEEIKTAANTDCLTTLNNRRHFIERAAEVLKSEDKTELVKILAVIHIDDFKAINDKYKHQTGDQVLVSFANLLNINFPKNAVVARLSGAEFAVLSMGEDATEIEDGLKYLQKEASRKQVKHNKETVKFTISISGIVVEPGDDFHVVLVDTIESLKKISNKGKSKFAIEGLIDLSK